MPTTSTPPTDSKPDGPVWAAIIAAGVGCAVFGILVDLAEAFPNTISKALNIYNPSGDLAGKSTLAVIIWVITWIALSVLWRNRQVVAPARLTWIAILLILIGLVAVFPPVIDLFAPR